MREERRVVGGSATRDAVGGLDSLRLFAALAVVFSHLWPNLPGAPGSAAGQLLWRVVTLPANGSAAVAMFFLISGFCIHLGQAATLRVNARVFLLRRGIRIGVPLIAILALSAWLGDWAATAFQSVLWSVYCELIYYATYPILLIARRRFAMSTLLFSSIALSVGFMIVFRSHAFAFHYDMATALVYLPLWVSGAWLAERHRAGATKTGSIVGWRTAALGLMIATNQINFPAFEFPGWLPFAVIGLFGVQYLPRELARWREVPPPAACERMGRASYSLYLLHIIPIALVAQSSFGWSFWPLLGAVSAAIALITFGFYTLCEYPSHRLARAIGRKRSSTPRVAPLLV